MGLIQRHGNPWNPLAGNVLHFNVTGSGNQIDFNHIIIADEIEAGGFASNIAVDCAFTGICDDITYKSGHFVANLLFLGFKS